MDDPEDKPQSQIVHVPTIAAKAQVNPVSIMIRHHGWITRADIAIEHEAIAKAARRIDEAERLLGGGASF